MAQHRGSRPIDRNRGSTTRQDRLCGLLFAVLCGYVAAAPVMDGARPRPWAIVGACTLVVVVSVAPRWLKPLTWACTWLGRQVQRVTTPVALGIFLYLVITPIGLGLRLGGKDVLGLRWDARRDSYWILRDPPGPGPETLRNQF